MQDVAVADSVVVDVDQPDERELLLDACSPQGRVDRVAFNDRIVDLRPRDPCLRLVRAVDLRHLDGPFDVLRAAGHPFVNFLVDA